MKICILSLLLNLILVGCSMSRLERVSRDTSLEKYFGTKSTAHVSQKVCANGSLPPPPRKEAKMEPEPFTAPQMRVFMALALLPIWALLGAFCNSGEWVAATQRSAFLLAVFINSLIWVAVRPFSLAVQGAIPGFWVLLITFGVFYFSRCRDRREAGIQFLLGS